MIDASQVEKFHKHLIAMQLAGIDVLSQLLDGTPQFQPQLDSIKPMSSIELWQEQLRSHAERLRLPESTNHELRSTGDLTEETTKAETQTFEAYQDCFRHWITNGEQIQTLQYLATTHRANQSSVEGTNVTLLYLLIYSSLALFAFLIVFGGSLGSVGGMIRQLRVTTAWPLEFLLALQPSFLWLLAGLVIASVLLAVKIIRHSRSVRLRKSDKTYHWLALAQRASAISGLFGTSRVEPTESIAQQLVVEFARIPAKTTPLLKWATSVDGSSEHRTNVLGLVQRLYLWLSNQRAKRISQNQPQILGTIIGGSLALCVGVLLFYPLVQTLITVIETAGSQP